MKILIKNGRIVDPSQNLDSHGDVLIEDERIARIGSIDDREATLVDAKGLVVCPGLIDMHTHLREPGREDEETIATGARAAIAGGFTSIACMANTEPPIEGEGGTRFVLTKARQARAAKVYPVAAVTKGLKGEALAEIGSAIKAGAVAISDDGLPIRNSSLMRRALEYVSIFGKPVLAHCEDLALSGNGVMHEGEVSTVLGMRGIPAEAEAIAIARDIMLAVLTRSRLHVCHLSTSQGVELLHEAKRKGAAVTCEVTPHHLVLTDESVRTFDTAMKVNPPLRSQTHVAALRRALKQGIIDAIASDHAPHALEEKDQEFALAPFGMIGLETTLGVVCTHIYHEGIISLRSMVELLSTNPARILGLNTGTLKEGSPADVTIFDPRLEWVVEPSQFQSRSRNCPFSGWKLKGKVVTVIVDGRIVFREGEIIGGS